MKHKWNAKMPTLFWISSRKRRIAKLQKQLKIKTPLSEKNPAHILIKEQKKEQ